MDLTTALDHARAHRNGVLTTLKRDGRPQLSNILYLVTDDGRIQISVTGDRAKAVNMRRDPRVSLYLVGDDFWHYEVIEGTASLTDEVTDPNGADADALSELYRRLAGEHDDWDDYRAALVRDRRLLVTITPEHAYGMWGD